MTEATRGYRELIVWQKAMQLVPVVYRLVKKLPAEERYALSDKIRRAVVSVAANIDVRQARPGMPVKVVSRKEKSGSIADIYFELLHE
jgi:uncharacterized OB-fold protein